MKQMFDKVKNRLPNLSDNAIMKLINNPASYKVVNYPQAENLVGLP